ncbi:2-oxoglutarate dehydrogenase complex dihydrolipoyllysine-residue succinyltransferase [Rhodospirillum centenum]|uniref:Dihydrolipoyllysine-residue succinyltransferase component of 2-oxoglutarate dehydrogenase complex n=1 Tax=Rhodospirillum centenum (strain ATCC 51521 / SW) TaxID=414684 RepID=B6IPE8_RHOCS|nr:2-oxoglutarate dehydrogenase complex dihydrolipoyllysine-residue succinyltransferase [Rhodospirillum centenum]ACI99650.1 2-oxoglutarate dehydrogenase, E2 component, dihydrolipoamide succinyltransferase [Rhodospirillum centenum SW]
MATEIKVPTLGESVTEATVARWMKKVGDTVEADEPLVELETDKVTLEVNAPAGGTLTDIQAEDGATVGVGALLGVIADGAAKPAAAPAAAPAQAAPQPAAAPAAAAAGVMPAARKMADDHGVDAGKIAGTGKDGRVTKGDVIQHLEQPRPAAAPAPAPTAPAAPAAKPAAPSGPRPRADLEERVRMTRLRQRIAERLKEAQDTAAMLTTFNEVDMTNVIAMRARLKDAFEKKHGVKLGFMSFFVKACIVALKEIPAVNAEIDGSDLVYKNYYDIGVAVGTPQGLVVPVVRDADRLGFAGVEAKIAELGKKARDGKLSIEDLSGGTFTISNGGVYGSLMSTPILNPPQSGILGMHKTMDRAVVVDGKVEVRPMMYLALSYDHRIIDGREAVTFLVRVKECIENPERILLDV